eukprot:IDg19794t1
MHYGSTVLSYRKIVHGRVHVLVPKGRGLPSLMISDDCLYEEARTSRGRHRPLAYARALILPRADAHARTCSATCDAQCAAVAWGVIGNQDTSFHWNRLSLQPSARAPSSGAGSFCLRHAHVSKAVIELFIIHTICYDIESTGKGVPSVMMRVMHARAP